MKINFIGIDCVQLTEGEHTAVIPLSKQLRKLLDSDEDPSIEKILSSALGRSVKEDSIIRVASRMLKLAKLDGEVVDEQKYIGQCAKELRSVYQEVQLLGRTFLVAR